LRAHALNTSTDTNLNHASLDLVRDIDASLKTRRALPVQGADSGSHGEAGNQAGRAHLGRTATGGEHSSDGNILDQGRVDLGAVDEGGEDAGKEIGGGGILEASPSTLGESSSAAGSDDDLWMGEVVSSECP